MQTTLIKEIPEQSRVLKYLLPTVEDVITVIAEYYNISILQIVAQVQKRVGNLPRKMAIYLSLDVTGLNQRSIAKVFEGISDSRVLQIHYRMRIELAKNKKLF